jgi:flagellar protein FlbD
MIRLTRINGEQVVVNADLIEFVEMTPDTLVTLFTGKKIPVRESADLVIERVVAYRRAIGATHTADLHQRVSGPSHSPRGVE